MRYGAHLTKEQVSELVAPHQGTLEIVHSWLEHHGLPSSSVSTSHGGGWLTITGVSVSRADKLLSASYQLYRHTGTNGTEAILRTVGYSLPAALHAHVQTIAPTTYFAFPHMSLQTPPKGSSEEAAGTGNASSGEFVRALERRQGFLVMPSYLRWLYKTEAYVPTAMGKNVIGIFGFQTGSPTQADLAQILTIYRADAVPATFTVVEVNGGVYDQSHPGTEENIHAQYAAAMAYPTPRLFYSTGGPYLWWTDSGRPAPGDVYLGWFRYVFDRLNKIPPTISILDANPEPGLPPEYAKALCNLFARLGARGVTVLVPSGDNGVGCGDCKDSSGNNTNTGSRSPDHHGSSGPWVTSVGGTLSHRPEVAVGFSGGGFSDHFPRPEYQADALPTFLKSLGTEFAGLYPPKGRGTPDVAAQANKFAYIRDNVISSASSTSCSTATCRNSIAA